MKSALNKEVFIVTFLLKRMLNLNIEVYSA